MTELEPLIYCLQAGFPHPIIASLLSLANGDDDLPTAWEVWRLSDYWPAATTDASIPRWQRRDNLRTMRAEFILAVENVANITAVTCCDCEEVVDAELSATVNSGDSICECCLDHNFATCEQCQEYHPSDEMNHVEDQDSLYCESCVSNYCSWCEDCEVWYRYDHESHDEGCDCEAPRQRFRFPANGKGTVTNDERLDLILPAGTIDEAGLFAIRSLLMTEGVPTHVVLDVMDAVGDQWQGKRGNFTRRLSRELHTNSGIKIQDGILSKIGNLAREHSSDTSTWAIEFTRNLNLSAGDFCHEKSCYWQSYYESRCALKNWGGLGIRMFDEDDYPIGRAWVQPVNEDLVPTHDTINAHAYVIYNCYGELNGAKAARIIAHLTSRTYRKIEVRSDPQYINGDSGWLVANEETCRNNDDIHFTQDAHYLHDAHNNSNIDQEVAA